MLKLTPENYYSHETDWDYMSFSLYKDFTKCEAAALAKISEDWQPTSSPTPLLVGNYIHSYFESPEAHQASETGAKTNRELMMTKPTKTNPDGHLRAEFKQADQMIQTLKNDKLFNYVYMPGEKEVIVTGKIGDHEWKGKIDSLVLNKGYFCDLKTVDDIHKKHWDAKNCRWTNFIEDRGYIMQAAIYQELIKQSFNKNCQPYIFGVSKQVPPDKIAISFDGDGKFLMQEALEKISNDQDHFCRVLMGEEPPKACGKCEYCRQGKQLAGFTEISSIEIS